MRQCSLILHSTVIVIVTEHFITLAVLNLPVALQFMP